MTLIDPRVEKVLAKDSAASAVPIMTILKLVTAPRYAFFEEMVNGNRLVLGRDLLP